MDSGMDTERSSSNSSSPGSATGIMDSKPGKTERERGGERERREEPNNS